VQQKGDGIRRKMTVSEPGDPHEVEADQAARAVMQLELAPMTDGQVVSRHVDAEQQQVAAKLAVESMHRQPEMPRPEDEEEKKKLHTKLDMFEIHRAVGEDRTSIGF
jgi:hypothetical protein